MVDHIPKNRASWNASSDAYQAQHGPQLEAKQNELAWGVFAIPERTLRALGEVEGRRVLVHLGMVDERLMPPGWIAIQAGSRRYYQLLQPLYSRAAKSEEPSHD